MKSMDKYFPYVLGTVIFCTLAGLVCSLATIPAYGVSTHAGRAVGSFVPLFYTVPAIFGGFFAISLLRSELQKRRYMRGHPNQPVNLSIDEDAQLATVQLAGGDIVSVHIPDEVVESGRIAVTAYLMEQFLEDDDE